MFSPSLKQLRRKLLGDTRVVVWKKHHLLYVRVPKSGNTSIRNAIEGAKESRMPARKIVRLDEAWTAFSFVRNPWSRLVSCYRQKAGPEATSKKMVDGVYTGFSEIGMPIRADTSFEEFCEVVCQMSDEDIEKHLKSQSHFLVREGRVIVPFIGKVEQMDADWEKVMQSAGLDIKIPHLNRTGKKQDHYSSYFPSSHLVNMVGDRYADDIRNFDYDFVRE